MQLKILFVLLTIAILAFNNCSSDFDPELIAEISATQNSENINTELPEVNAPPAALPEPEPDPEPEPEPEPEPVVIPPPAYDTRLQHFYKFDDLTANIALDATGNMDGALLNGAKVASSTRGSSVRFDGVDDFVNLGIINVSGNKLTISALISVTSFANVQSRIISKATGPTEQDHLFMLSSYDDNGTIRARFRLKTLGITSTLKVTSGELTLNKWIHLCAVYDGQNMIMYQDGVEVGRIPKTGSMDQSTNALTTIGMNPDGYNPFDGRIDEVKIYNHALSATEVDDMY